MSIVTVAVAVAVAGGVIAVPIIEVVRRPAPVSRGLAGLVIPGERCPVGMGGTGPGIYHGTGKGGIIRGIGIEKPPICRQRRPIGLVLTVDNHKVRRDAHVLTYGDIGDDGGSGAGGLQAVYRPAKFFISERQVKIGMNDHQLKLSELVNRRGGKGTVIRRIVGNPRRCPIRRRKGLLRGVV